MYSAQSCCCASLFCKLIHSSGNKYKAAVKMWIKRSDSFQTSIHSFMRHQIWAARKSRENSRICLVTKYYHVYTIRMYAYLYLLRNIRCTTWWNFFLSFVILTQQRYFHQTGTQLVCCIKSANVNLNFEHGGNGFSASNERKRAE